MSMPAVEATANKEQLLWQEWLLNKDSATRTQLFFFYSEWCRVLTGYLFKRYPHPLAEWPDYVNLASIGLLQAIDGFDPSRKIRFQAYAEPYIKGGILKGLACYVRDRRPVVHDRLAGMSEGNGPGESETDFEKVISAAVDLAFGYFLELGIVSQEPVDNNPLSAYETASIQEVLDQMIGRLSVNEQRVIRGHYYQYLSFVELSDLLGLTKSRISQIHTQGLRRIREFYEAIEEWDSNW